MKTQSGFRVIMNTAWLATAATIRSASAADFGMNDTAVTDPAGLDWTGLSSQVELVRDDAPNAYIGTSLTETQAPDRLDWTGLSKCCRAHSLSAHRI